MDSEYEDDAGEPREASAAGAGQQLRAAREALRLELAHIAADTRIPLRHLEAIEAGDFEALPSRAYAIGFSRTFAKAVGLDETAITDAVRAELADGSMRRTVPSSGMEPGDPARVPSAGLAWAGAAAALLLAIGAFAFYNSYFGAGTEPEPLAAPQPETPVAAPVAEQSPAVADAATGGAVVLTALEEGVWLRLYEEGGARLTERTLKAGESVAVPATAADPRINTGRPDALAITVGGKPVARLSERPTTIAGAPVSAAALLARPAPTLSASASASASVATAPAQTTEPARRPAQRAARVAPTTVAPTAEPAPSPAPPPSSEPALAAPAAADTPG
ncbi:hypothetical protein CHX26_15155 [Porphyrobacter sp. HT-58-2]|uniref:helix-turn-helix domain-containing protein n=1 Tax=Porphyrobacter sp. HT-58-2 TaxID=2023229 RepID=UPI000CDCBBA6|nr:helix-turn-helix domain-containing protein [Porphyrobacter sp. HT-58-2]AUX70655.1 hypothetical protein CHX26_15155 [Porphyrobacter sp. HT-58-2]